MKNFFRTKSGITLISLVVTIIILLILAGITISQLSGNGIFEKAKEARDKWQNAQNEEETQISKYSNAINNYIDSTRQENTIKNESFVITSQYTIASQNCYYIPSTGQVHVFICLDPINKKVGTTATSDADKILAVIPEKYRPSSNKYGLSIGSNGGFTGGDCFINENGELNCYATQVSLSWASFSIDYTI